MDTDHDLLLQVRDRQDQLQKQIQEVRDLKALLSLKGLLDPEVTLEVSTSDWRPVRLQMHYKVREESVSLM